MIRLITLLVASIFLLSACEAPAPQLGADGKPLPRIYRISKGEASRVQFRMLDAVNALRRAAGAGDVALNASLNAAAATHSRDMSVQNRPWHFGSDGSSPLDRALRAGYTQTLLGENISETFESELETLAAWMEVPETRVVILDPQARDMGISWFQEPGGKIWWTLVMGGGGPARQPAPVPQAELPQG